jgi:hypothetical protein
MSGFGNREPSSRRSSLPGVDAKMAALLEAVEWWAYHSGYARRQTILEWMREYPM